VVTCRSIPCRRGSSEGLTLAIQYALVLLRQFIPAAFYLSQFNYQTVRQYNIYSEISKDSCKLYPLKLSVIRLYIKEGERAIFTPANLYFEISNFTVYGSNEIYNNFTVLK
jgi:hypothetical protein